MIVSSSALRLLRGCGPVVFDLCKLLAAGDDANSDEMLRARVRSITAQAETGRLAVQTDADSAGWLQLGQENTEARGTAWIVNA